MLVPLLKTLFALVSCSQLCAPSRFVAYSASTLHELVPVERMVTFVPSAIAVTATFVGTTMSLPPFTVMSWSWLARLPWMSRAR